MTAEGSRFGVAAAAASAFFLRQALRDLAAALERMADGDSKVRVAADGAGELGRLSRAVNRLAEGQARALDGLRAERDLFAGILDGMGEGVLVLDADERVVHCNRALRAMARVGEDAVGKPLLEAIRNATLKEALEVARESPEPVVREIELGRPLPRKLLVRVSRLDALGARAHGPEEGTIAVFHDVTDLRRLETIRTDFVANVSHELRTPVTAISTATETLIGGALQDPADAAEFVGVIDRHAQRLRQLVDDLLDLSKLEAKSFRLVLSDLEVEPVLAHALALVDDRAQRRRMTLSLDTGPDGGKLVAKADRRALEQVVLNLLDNALKYAGEGTHVRVSARPIGERGDRIEISVADDGAGISPAHLGRVFERFYRVDAGRSRELGGTGLGLSIVKHLIELMGGTIDVESEPGKGACFTLRLASA